MLAKRHVRRLNLRQAVWARSRLSYEEPECKPEIRLEVVRRIPRMAAPPKAEVRMHMDCPFTFHIYEDEEEAAEAPRNGCRMALVNICGGTSSLRVVSHCVELEVVLHNYSETFGLANRTVEQWFPDVQNLGCINIWQRKQWSMPQSLGKESECCKST